MDMDWREVDLRRLCDLPVMECPVLHLTWEHKSSVKFYKHRTMDKKTREYFYVHYALFILRTLCTHSFRGNSFCF